MTHIERIRFIALMVVLAVAGAAGCSTPKMFSLNSTWPFGDDEPKPEVPTRVAGMWTDTVLHKAGEKPQRGFGGRLMFYGKDAEKPVLVEGELVVYAFDETGRDPTDNKPTRRYVFPADQLSLRMSESPVGPSYSFFLPWDEAGGPQTEVSLICRFQPKGGAVVVSEQTKHLLPGAMRPAGAVAANTPPKLPEGIPSRPALPTLSSQLSGAQAAAGGAQQASYQVVTATGAVPATIPSQMTTTSIALPRDFQIPQGVAPAPINSITPAVRQILPPGQAMPLEMTRQPAAQLSAPATSGVVPAVMPAQSPNAASPANRSATRYQPTSRFVTPAAYSPTIASAAHGSSVNQPLQVPPMQAVAPPTIAPLVAPQQVQMPPQAGMPTTSNGSQMVTTLQPGQQLIMQPQLAQQAAPQMMQIPATGTASVTYR